MPVRSKRLDRVDLLLEKLSHQEHPRKAMELGIEISNEILLHLGLPEEKSRSVEDVLDDAFANSEFKNQKMESWFQKHPILGNARIALHHVQESTLPYESKFYMFSEETTKVKIAASSNLFTHWEDSELTKFPTYKVGIHFFLSHDGSSFYFVISNASNIRVLELQERLSNTQSEIFEGLKDVLTYQGQGENEPQQTIHTSLWKALELTAVNKRFYEGVADAFTVLVQHLDSQAYEKKEAQLFSSRLLGRLIFIWFLRKKNIIHESMGYFEPAGLSDDTYYQEKLKPLFFDTLNTAIEDRSHTDHVTPYLNGGLFEAHENDWIDQIVPFPKNWFQELFNHFNRFNFTTDESTPEYEQVAIDPEMLGRVFENLLASVVPETSNAASDRKNKGAFYTPREIVSFMTKESLIQYLKTKINNEKFHFGIDQLIDLNDAKFLEQKSTGDLQLWGNASKEVQSKIISALDSIKVLDPACGSGAFPIGMMQLLAQTYERIQAFFVPEVRSHRLAQGTERFDSYQTKLHIIQSSLFGSDIEPMAIEIARLRTWLSLVIEDMNKVEPLPNLDFNFVCANSLIPLENEEQISIFDDTDYEERLSELREEFFSTHDINTKLKLKQRFIDLYDEKLHSSENSKRINQLRTWNPFVASEPADFFDAKVMFDLDKFSIVIGNPPYKKTEFIPKAELKTLKEIYGYTSDYYIYFSHRAFQLTEFGGILSFITNDGFMGLKNAERLRLLLLNNNLISITGCPLESFTASIYTAIFIISKTQSELSEQQLMSEVEKDYYETNIFVNERKGLRLVNLGNVSKKLSVIAPNKRLFLWNQELEVIEKINNFKKINDYLLIMDTGIHSGNVRDKLFFYENSSGKLQKLIQGRQISKYRLLWDTPKAKYRFVNLNYKPLDDYGSGRGGKKSPLKEYWHWVGSRENHELDLRIVIRQTDDEIIATIIDKNIDGQIYTDNTLFTAIPKGEVDIYFLLIKGYLNSKTLNKIYQIHS
jgi:type I restriction-modification system DNA methylase subunit